MSLKTITTKVDENQLKELKNISKKTKWPQSVIIRWGIDFILNQLKEDVLSPEFRSHVETVITEDKHLLNKLSKI